MTWARLDDRFWSNRKVVRAWKRNRGSVGLYALALTYCAQHETDGTVDAEWVEDRLPKASEREALMSVLVDVGLVDRDGDDYEIHDYLDYNPSREKTIADREDLKRQRSEAGKKGAAARWQTDGKPLAPANDKNGSRPVPSLPNPITHPGPPKGGNRRRDRERWENEIDAWAAEHFPHWLPVEQRSTAVRQAAIRGKAYDVDAVKAHIEQWFPKLAALEAA